MWLHTERLFQDAPRTAHRLDRVAVGTPTLELPAPAKKQRKDYRSPGEVAEDELLEALRANRWRIQKAAAHLGISRTSLYERIDKSSRLKKAVDLPRQEIEACQARCRGNLDAMAELLEVSKRGLQRRMSQLGLAGARRQGSGEMSAAASDTGPT